MHVRRVGPEKAHFVSSAVLALLALLATTRCTAKKVHGADAVSLKSAYRQAVRDASGDDLPVLASLHPVSEENDRLVRHEDGARILVVTWTAFSGYQVGAKGSYGEPIWVTAVPEVRDFCRQMKATDLRLKQWLGLPPDVDKTYFVEFWVDPEDLYRPCPDPEISDRACERRFPSSPYFTIDEAYVTWFDDWRSVSYKDEGGYPWTRLGYTYDWANPERPFGASEYVIMPNHEYEVASISPTDAYCGR